MPTTLLANKILPLLVMPLGLGLLFLLAGMALRRRFLLGIGVLVLWVFSMPVVGEALIRAVEGRSGRVPVSSVPAADALVVLSGMVVQVDGAPLGEWGDASDRFEGAIELFKAGKAPLLVFTAGQLPWQPDAIPEGELLARRALLLGVPKTAILLTAKAGNTAEEAAAARKLLGVDKSVDRTVETGQRKKIILVTSAYHMRRAVLLFEKAGFWVEPFPVDFQVSNVNRFTVLDCLPDAWALGQSSKALREVIGWAFYRFGKGK